MFDLLSQSLNLAPRLGQIALNGHRKIQEGITQVPQNLVFSRHNNTTAEQLKILL